MSLRLGHSLVRRARLRRLERHPRIVDANGADPTTHLRSALLVYLPRAFTLPENDPAFRRHQNLGQCRSIAALLGERGYVVDVVSKRDLNFRPRRSYDLIVSERLDWQGVDEAFREDAVKVFLATSMNHVHHNRNLRRRHERLYERRGRTLRVRRIYGESMPAVRSADAVVAFGDERSAGTWADASDCPVHGFNNYGFPGTRYEPERKDFAGARHHFLYLASRSQMQKGLDLLLELFPRHPDLHLYVCSQYEQETDFCALYRTELFETPNVHPLGFVDVHGAEFDELARTCAYVIAPTCSEGQAGAVVQGMHAGLIPLVTVEAGIGANGFGVEFADDGIEEIERVVREAAGRSAEWHRERSRLTRAAALAEFSEESFASRWRQILDEILDDHGGR